MDNKELRQKLAELDGLREELVGRLQQTDGIKALEDAQPKIKPGSAEHETLLSTGYDMTKAEAERIIAERDKEPERWPLSEYRKAKAFLAALSASPSVVSTRKPWRTRGSARATVRG